MKYPDTCYTMRIHLEADHDLTVARDDTEPLVTPVTEELLTEHNYAHYRDEKAGIGHIHEEDL